MKVREIIRRTGSFLLGGGVALLILTPLLLLLEGSWVLITIPIGAFSSISGFLMGGLEYKET